ncbi:MAG: hypothetical protein OHK0037_39400 [Elainellaceae cyanobacterium]
MHNLLTAAILQLPMPETAERVASGKVVRAMQMLMALVDEVRSPENGWDANTLPTPEAIAPYVGDEACDLLEALEAGVNDSPFSTEFSTEFSTDKITQPKAAPLWTPYCTLDSLTPKLLWGLARSAVEVMRLLESVPATVAPAGTVRQRGRLRLAAVLELHAENGTQRYDLVMHQPGRSLLSPDAQVYKLDGDALSAALSAGQLLTAIAQRIDLSTPALSPLLVGLPIQLLLPEHDWQPATLRLHLELEFLPGVLPVMPQKPDGFFAGTSEQPDVPPSSAEDALPTTLQFSPGAWLQRYCTHLSDHALTHQILNLAGCRAVSEAVFPLPAEEVVPRLVADAVLLLDSCTHSPLFAPVERWQDRMQGDRLRSRLLWSLSRSSPALMQLLGGVRVRMLQPEAPWDAGTLRLLVTLKLQTPEMDWYIDLATGRMPEPTVFPLAADVVVQAGDLELAAQPDAALPPLSLHQPTPLKQLTEHVMQQIETAVPEVHLLLEGTAVDLWSDTDPEPHPATLQVLVDFDFVPDICI